MAAASLLFPPSYSHSLTVFTTIKPFSFSILSTSKPTYFSLLPSSSKPSSTSSSPITPKKKSRASSIHYSIPTTNPSSFDPDANEWDPSQHEALLKGGEQVTSVLEEMITLLEDMELDAASEAAAVELAAQGVIGKRVDEMESGFMMALDYMIQIADKDSDDQRKSLLEVIKRTVLDHLTKKCPPHVQVIGLLCRTPQKESRHELLRRVAAGGGVFKSENGLKVQLPAANLNDIANQADDLLETMESRPAVPDRKLLARLVLIREEARNMMGGGLLDERNVRGLSTLPEAEVNYLSKLVSLRPGKTVKEMISNVMHGKDEGADTSGSGDESSDNTRQRLGGIAGRGSVTGRKPRPVRPGMFLETVSKVLSGIYAGSESGITAQHLEWGMKGLQIPAFGNWDDCDDMPITQHFESAVQAGLIKSHLSGEEEDLFKVPVASMKPTYQRKLKKGEINKQGNRVHDLTTKSPRKQHKAVDEDLYKIPPELLYQKPKRNRMRRNFWSGCLGSNCVACA